MNAMERGIEKLEQKTAPQSSDFVIAKDGESGAQTRQRYFAEHPDADPENTRLLVICFGGPEPCESIAEPENEPSRETPPRKESSPPLRKQADAPQPRPRMSGRSAVSSGGGWMA
jgi:hypothetical protein